MERHSGLGRSASLRSTASSSSRSPTISSIFSRNPPSLRSSNQEKHRPHRLTSLRSKNNTTTTNNNINTIGSTPYEYQLQHQPSSSIQSINSSTGNSSTVSSPPSSPASSRFTASSPPSSPVRSKSLNQRPLNSKYSSKELNSLQRHRSLHQRSASAAAHSNILDPPASPLRIGASGKTEKPLQLSQPILTMSAMSAQAMTTNKSQRSPTRNIATTNTTTSNTPRIPSPSPRRIRTSTTPSSTNATRVSATPVPAQPSSAQTGMSTSTPVQQRSKSPVPTPRIMAPHQHHPSVPPYSDKRRRSLVLTQPSQSSPSLPTVHKHTVSASISSTPRPAPATPSPAAHSVPDLKSSNLLLSANSSRVSMTPVPTHVPPMNDVWLDDEEEENEDKSRPLTSISKKTASLKHWSLSNSNSMTSISEKRVSQQQKDRKSLSASLRKGLHWKRREEVILEKEQKKEQKAVLRAIDNRDETASIITSSAASVIESLPKQSIDTVRSSDESLYSVPTHQQVAQEQHTPCEQTSTITSVRTNATNATVSSNAPHKSWKFWSKKTRNDSISDTSIRKLEISAPSNLVHMTSSGPHHASASTGDISSSIHADRHNAFTQRSLRPSLYPSPLAYSSSSPANSRPTSLVGMPTYTAKPHHLSEHSTSSASTTTTLTSNISSPSNTSTTTPMSDSFTPAIFNADHQPPMRLRNQCSSDSFGWVTQTSDFVEQQKWLIHNASYDSDLNAAGGPPQVPPPRRPLTYGERKRSVLLPSAPIMSSDPSPLSEQSYPPAFNPKRASRIDLHDVQEELEHEFAPHPIEKGSMTWF